MEEYKATMRRYTKYTLYLLALFVLGWGFSTYQTVFQGLIIGVVFSYFNLWNSYRKIDKFGQSVVEGKKAHSLGMLTRFGTAALLILIATRYPETFHLLSVIIGLMSTYIIILIDSLFHQLLIQGKR